MIPRPNAPRRQSVDDVVRRAILRVGDTMGVSEEFILNCYISEEGYGSIPDALAGIEHRHQLLGEPIVGEWARRMRRRQEHAQDLGMLPILGPPQPSQEMEVMFPYAVKEALSVMPDVEFLAAIEAAGRAHSALKSGRRPRRRTPRTPPSFLDRVDDIFRLHGLPWAADDRIRWIGEPVLQEAAIDPALDVLVDRRLDTARAAFDAASLQLRHGHPKALETSILESGKAVEATLVALLHSHGSVLPRRQTAKPLWDACVKEGLIDGMWESTILAASGPRNHLAAHPPAPGSPLASRSDAEATFAAAALAIRLLAAALPQR